MKGLFNLDSPFAQFMGCLGDLMILNLLFLVSCLPLVTIGAAVTAMAHSVNRILANDEEQPFQTYLKAFKTNFKQATILFGGVLLVALVFRAWFVVAELCLSGTGEIIMKGILYAIMFRIGIMVIWLFPLQAKFENPLTATLKNAYLLSFRHFLTTLMVIVITGLLVVVTIFYPVIVGYGLLWFLLGFSGLAFVKGILFHRIFQRYMPKKDEEMEHPKFEELTDQSVTHKS